MQQYNKTLNCQYCGIHIGNITLEDIDEPAITDIQCSKCEVDEQ